MRLNKIFYKTLILALLISSTAYGQLLERENVQSKIVQGTRPVAGNFGYVIGPSIVEVEELFDQNVDIRGFPLMGLKYYVTDNFEVRLTSQIFGTSEKIEGDLVNQIGEEDNIQRELYYRLMPSAFYHFSSSNFLDTYVGVGLIVGTEINEAEITTKTNLTGDYSASRYKQSTTDLGFNVSIGMQAFIADLPFSIGFEASVRSLMRNNLQYEAATQSSVGGVVNEQTFFTRDDQANAVEYEALEYSQYEVGSDLRVLFTYYFRR